MSKTEPTLIERTYFVVLSVEHHERVKRLEKEFHYTAEHIVRNAVSEYLDRIKDVQGDPRVKR